MESTTILLIILVVAVLGRANSVAIATCILLFIKLVHADQHLFPFIEKEGVFWGLVLLIAAILVPIARGDITQQSLCQVFTSWAGIIALLLSLLTTYLSGQGLEYLTLQGHAEIMPALIVGAVAAAAFLGGVPVGPLIASGILALVMKLLKWS